MPFASKPTRRQVLAAAASIAAVPAAAPTATAQTSRPPALRSEGVQFVEFRRALELPPVRLTRHDGRAIELSSFRGKVVILNFWATWCPPCRRELPLLDKLSRIVDPRRFEVAAVSIDQGNTADVTVFLKRLEIRHLQTYRDPDRRIASGPSDAAQAPLALYAMPISYIIDRFGRATGYVTGEIDWTTPDALALLDHYAQI